MQGENLGGGCSGVCGCGGGGENKNKSEIAKEIEGYIESLPISSFVLGSMLSSYPLNNFNDLLPNLIQQVERSKKSPNIEQSWLIAKNTVLTWSKEKALEDLRAEYVDLFERGHKRPSPYESEYGNPQAMQKQHVLADLAGFYQAAAFEIDGESADRELVDHIAVELEFYGLALSKEAYSIAEQNYAAAEIMLAMRRAFVKDHLGRFITALARAPRVQEHPFYGPVFSWCRDLVLEEAGALGITISELSFPISNEEPPSGCCGGCT